MYICFTGETPDEDGQLIVIAIMSAIVLIIFIAIIVATGVLYYECKKPEKRKPNKPAKNYQNL